MRSSSAPTCDRGWGGLGLRAGAGPTESFHQIVGVQLPVNDRRLDEAWDQALALAWESLRADTTPVGAVVVAPDGSVVATGRGRRYERDGPARHLANSHVAHAEINALAQLEATRRWEDHLLLTTLEPCGMCHGAAIQARVSTVVYAGPDPYGGTAGLRFFSPQSRRRPLSVVGPLADARGAFATLLHLVWLMERTTAAHVVAEHEKALPEFTRYCSIVRRDLLVAAAGDDYAAAFALATEAPW